MITVQTAVKNAVTELSLNYTDMVNLGDFQYGFNSDGAFLLNQDDGTFERSFTLATSDFAVKNPKKIRYIYIGIDTSNPFTVSVKADNGTWVDRAVTNLKNGLQRIRVPIGMSLQGRYWTIKITSDYYFRIDQIDVLLIVRPSGIKGY